MLFAILIICSIIAFKFAKFKFYGGNTDSLENAQNNLRELWEVVNNQEIPPPPYQSTIEISDKPKNLNFILKMTNFYD